MNKCRYYPNCDICDNEKNCILKKEYPKELQELEKEIQYELNYLNQLDACLSHKKCTNQIITEREDTIKLLRGLRKEEFELNKKIGQVKIWGQEEI